jgi:exosortase/archaeosortase
MHTLMFFAYQNIIYVIKKLVCFAADHIYWQLNTVEIQASLVEYVSMCMNHYHSQILILKAIAKSMSLRRVP